MNYKPPFKVMQNYPYQGTWCVLDAEDRMVDRLFVERALNTRAPGHGKSVAACGCWIADGCIAFCDKHSSPNAGGSR